MRPPPRHVIERRYQLLTWLRAQTELVTAHDVAAYLGVGYRMALRDLIVLEEAGRAILMGRAPQKTASRGLWRAK